MHKFALNLADDGRVLSVTYAEFSSPNMPLVETIPDGNVADYRYQDDEFLYEPLPAPEAVKQEDLSKKVAELEESNRQLQEALNLLLSGETEVE